MVAPNFEVKYNEPPQADSDIDQINIVTTVQTDSLTRNDEQRTYRLQSETFTGLMV